MQEKWKGRSTRYFLEKYEKLAKAYASTGVLSVVLYSQSCILRGTRLKALRTMYNLSIA